MIYGMKNCIIWYIYVYMLKNKLYLWRVDNQNWFAKNAEFTLVAYLLI
jgi:hypothetical protein